MPLNDALGDGNSALRDDLLRQYQQDAPNFSGDAAVLTERLSRKLATPGSQPSFEPTDFSDPPPPVEAEPKAQDLSSFGDPAPDPSTDDLSSFGTPVATEPEKPLGAGGQLLAAGKGLLRAPLEQAGSILQGTAALSPSKPVPVEGTALIDQLGGAGTMSASERAKLMGQFMRTVGDRGLQMDFNSALQRIARGGDAAAESAKLRERFGTQDAESAKPIQEQAKYKTGTAVKDAADVIPMSDQEKASGGAMVGGAVGGALPYVAAGALMGPAAAVALGVAGMGTSTAGSTFEAAKAKGATDEDAAKAAGWGGAIGAVLGGLPLATVLRPITAVSARLGSSGAAILAQHAIEGGAAFATVGEAQEFLLTKVAQQYYDPEKGYSPDAKRIISNLIGGAIVGGIGGAITRPRPNEISSPADIAAFIQRANEARARQSRDVAAPTEPPAAAPGNPPESRPNPPDNPPAGAGEAATPPKTDHETLLDAGFSEKEIADMSPRARATRLAEAKTNEPATSKYDVGDLSGKTDEQLRQLIDMAKAQADRMDATANDPVEQKRMPKDTLDHYAGQAKIARDGIEQYEAELARRTATGRRDAPIVATSVDDVLKASEVVKEPTEAQAKAGNYQHGHLELPHLGLDGKNGVSIETGVGQLRKGTAPDGSSWEVRMPVAYGKIKGTVGADGDHVDVFIGPKPDSQHVFIVDQRHAGTENFDEHKVLVGFEHPEGAIRAYRDSYADDATPRIGAVTALNVEQFKDWLANGDHTKRFSEEKSPVSTPHGNNVETGGGAQSAESIPQVAATGRDGASSERLTPTNSFAADVSSRLPTEAPKKEPATAEGAGSSQGNETGALSQGRTTRKPVNGSDQPLTLLQFIASEGGLAPHPELDVLDIGNHRVQIPGRKGFFGVIRPTGDSLHIMREKAEQAGYLKGEHNKTSTERDLLDHIDEEANRANPKRAEGHEDHQTKRQRQSAAESSEAARQKAIDAHHDDIEADEDYRHVPDDVKTRAATIMADEGLPLDDAIEQAAMRLVSEDADYAVPAQTLQNTYGKGVHDEIQSRSTSDHGGGAERDREEGGNAGAKEKAQGDGAHVPDTRAPSGEREEVTAEHHQAIEDALGPMAEQVLPVDVTRAAELLAERPDMPPGIAFQHAVIEGAVNRGDLTIQQAEEAYGPEVKTLLESGSEGTHRGGAHADQGGTEPVSKRPGSTEEARVVPRGGQAGGGAEGDDREPGDREADQQPDAGRADANTAGETGGGAEPETAADQGRTASRAIETALDKIEEAVEAGDRDAVLRAAGAARDVLDKTPQAVKDAEPDYWIQFKASIAKMAKPGYVTGKQEAMAEAERWWKNDLTGFGKEQAVKAAGLPDRVAKMAWHYIKPEDQYQLANVKSAPAGHPQHVSNDEPPETLWDVASIADRALSGNAAKVIDQWVGGPAGAAKAGATHGIMRWEPLEEAMAANGQVSKDIAEAFVPVKRLLRETYGDKITLHRYERSATQPAGRTLYSYTLDQRGMEHYANAPKERPLYTEDEIKAAEKTFAEAGKVKIPRSVYSLERQPEGHIFIMDPSVGGMVTDTDSVRAFMDERNDTIRENNDRRAKALEGAKTETIPLDQIVWVTDRFHQQEFIVRKPPVAAQTSIPGTEPIGQGEQARRKMNEGLKPKVAQQPADDGLFGDGHKQTDLMDMVNAKPVAKVPKEPNISPSETTNGLPLSVSGRDAGSEPEDVSGAESIGRSGKVSDAESERSAPAVSGTDEGRTEGTGQSPDDAGGAGSRGAGEGDDVRVSGRHADELAGGAAGAARSARSVKGENFHIEPGGLREERGPKAKAIHNIEAIETAARIIAEERPATLAEQQKLSQYVGWGGLKNAFPDADGEYGKGFEDIGPRIKELLTPEEYDTARRSIQYAHYTSEDIIGSMWSIAQQLGFKGGSVFEPGMGVGHFAGLMPPDLAGVSTYQGVELDHVSARIAKLLYPKWGVRREDFTRMPLPENAFDLAIGNPPFADIGIHADPKYPQGFLLHDYFFAKSLDAVRPGGLMMFVTSAGTMNKIDAKARYYLADRADLVGAIRLPSNAFKKNAGTEVTTDIVILRKRLPQEKPNAPGWVATAEVTLPGPDGKPLKGQISSYFANNPEMVLGKADFADKLYEGRYSVKAWDNFDLKAALAVAATKLPRNVMSEAETPTQRAEADFDHNEKKPGSYYIDKAGDLRQMQDGAGQLVAKRGKGIKGGKSAGEVDRITGLIPIRDALRETYKADLADDATAGAIARKKLNKAYDAFVAKFGPINKAEIQLRAPSVVQQEGARAKARENARYAGEFFDEGSFDPTAMFDANRPIAEIARARKEAKEKAIAEGKKWSEGSFDPEDMPLNILDKRPNIEPFMDDQEAYRLRAIEKYDDASQKAEKGLVFTKNVISRDVVPTIKSVNDAALYVLNQKGHLDLEAIGAMVNKSKSETIEALGDRIYRTPGTKDTWETREAYLSGNVLKKLALAKKEAARDPQLRRNVDALEAVQPPQLAPAQIHASLGMPWIPPHTIVQFATEELGLTSLKANYTAVLAQWHVSGDTDSLAAVTTWGTSRRNATALLSDALNHVTPKIIDKHDDGSSTLNVAATQAAQEKLQAIKDKFKNWIFADDARADPLAAHYNENYNNLVVREYDGSYLTTPGIAHGWTWRPHQTRVISRIIESGNTYMAHAVGAGKTSAMIGAGMEMRRLGLVKKPMYAVPNHMLGQFTKEFYEQYPTARIAVADERNFHTDRRKQFMANVALDDLDAVIITHTNLGMIPVSDEFSDEMIQQEMDRYRSALADMPKGQDNRITRSRIEKQIERLEQRLSGKSNRRRDSVFTFDEMGIDFLFVDEAHEYRKLDFTTQMSNLKGITPDGSAMAWDLYVKSKLLEKKNPGRNLVLASGTPVTNTMAELYTLSRYLQPAELAERNLSQFDAWAGAFGEEVSELEQDAAGGYKAVSRFAKFVNTAELSAMVRQVMDVVTSRQLEQYVTRPQLKGGKRQMHLAEKSPALEAYQDGLAARMKAIQNRGGKPQKGDDIMLTVIGDGRHAAIDMRLVEGEGGNGGPRVSDEDFPSKLELLIDNVHQTIKDTSRTKFYRPHSKGGYDMSAPVDVGPATQMIFANLGISAKRGLPVHEYIRAELVRRGVPRDKIALISEHKTHVAKQKLFNDMNAGKVLVMIGSTKKMSTGVNAQRRLVAIHNLDPLWYPSDDEQRNGRGIRQGNWNPEIAIHDYSTKGTYDSSMWGLMAKKARFIQGFFEGDPSMRDMEDLGEASQYEQAKALTTNDPRLMKLTELKQDLERASRRREAFESERYALKRKQAESRSSLDYYSNREVALQQDIRQRQDLSGDNFKGTIGKTAYDKRVEFGGALLDQFEKVMTSENVGRHITIGEISGFPIQVVVKWSYTERAKVPSADIVLKRAGNNETTVGGTSAMGITQSITGILAGFDSDLVYVRDKIATAEKFLKDSAGKETARFQGEPEIDRLAAEVRTLETELAKKDEEKPTDEAPPSPEAMASVEPLTLAGAAKRAELERLLTEAVHKMAPTVQIKFHDGLIPHKDQGGWGDIGAQYKGVVGLYRPAKQLIELSMQSGNPVSTAFHEAYHAIEHLLQTARERELMVKETPRIRKALDNKLIGFSAEVIKGMAGYEIRAVGFELYRHQREKFGKGQGLHVGVRRWYHRLTDMTNRIKNGVQGLGFQTAEDIFAKAFEGGFADRTPPLLGVPFPKPEESLASVRNPFNGPLRDSVGEAIDEKLASKKERFIEGYENLSRPVNNLQNIVEARLAGELPDSQAFARKKKLYPGKVAAEAHDFNKNLLDPMVDLLKRNGIESAAAGDILYALHAPERNREMDKINMDSMFGRPDMVLGRGSGMTNDTAAQILARYSPALVAQIDQRANAIRGYINNLMVQSGLESAGTVAGWNETYDHYVPLSGWEDAPEEAPYGHGGKFNVRGPEVRSAFGRRSKADNPLANLFDQAYRTIERAKKNEYLQALDNALHELEPDDLQNFVRFDKGSPEKKLDKRTGLVKTVESSNFRNDPGAVAFKRGGKVSYIIFENPRLADSIKLMHADGIGYVQKLIDFQNKLKATWTHYSPEFLVRHFLFRYPIEGALNSFEQKEHGQHSVGRYIADSTPFLGSASKAIFASNKGVTHSNPHIAELQRYWAEMQKAGGSMMFRQMRDTNLVREHMKMKLNSLTNSKWSNAKDKWQTSVEAMDTVTNALDNALRLAAYASARKQGKTPEQAAVIARDATVDFQQSGRWKNLMSLFAPFSSVAIATGARMDSAVARSRIMRMVFGSSILAGFLSGMFNYLVGGDDKDGLPFADKMAWWEKALTFTLINPYDTDSKGRPQPIHIPMPYNWAFPMMIGQAAAAMVFTKDPHGVKKALGALLRSGLEALTPFGAEHNIVAQITPELTRPIVHSYTNESWNGVPVHRDPAFQKGPRSESGRATTGDGWKWMASGINASTGGDRKHSGVLDVYPEDLRDVLSYYSGTDTIMRFGRNVATSVGHVVNGEPQEPSRIPFARVVRGTDYDAADKSRKFEKLKEEKQPWTR